MKDNSNSKYIPEEAIQKFEDSEINQIGDDESQNYKNSNTNQIAEVPNIRTNKENIKNDSNSKYFYNEEQNKQGFNNNIIININQYESKTINNKKIKRKKKRIIKERCCCCKCNMNNPACASFCGNRGFIGFYCCLFLCLILAKVIWH